MSNRRPKISPANSLSVSQVSLGELLRIFNRITSQAPPEGVKVPGPCWRWDGHVDKKGYGQVHFRGKTVWVHRLLYAIFRAGVPALREIDHRCKKPSCCNPWHLRRRSRSENCADIRRKEVAAVTADANFDPDRW